MGYLIIRVEPAELSQAYSREQWKAQVVMQIVRRHRLGSIDMGLVEQLLDRHGFELGPVIGVPTPKTVWNLTAYVYTSPSKDGVGRVGSTLHRWPCRRKEGTNAE